MRYTRVLPAIIRSVDPKLECLRKLKSRTFRYTPDIPQAAEEEHTQVVMNPPLLYQLAEEEHTQVLMNPPLLYLRAR